MRTMTTSFATGFVLMLITVIRTENVGIDTASVMLFIISILLSGIPILVGKIIMYRRKNRLTRQQKSGKIILENSSLKRIG